MKKLILTFLFSFLTVICIHPVTNYALSPSHTSIVMAQNKQATSARANLVSLNLVSSQEVPMGETEMIFEVVDNNGNPVKVENLHVSSVMPMDHLGMEDMKSKVEVQSTEKAGRFQVTTYFNMQGTWNIVATVKDPQYQTQQEFVFNIK